MHNIIVYHDNFDVLGDEFVRENGNFDVFDGSNASYSALDRGETPE